ncbi:homoserine kinase [Glacieibacterium frigidum]|uniref:Homoserine kinase n=1 Tax=Glacieibacterium frigidum TaxID=2593303 RepID=A0A552UJ81_9SPHN|nr:homoserine kinase [Glacieibacterium frigidum]TRW18293.1 homoserine kinase [Glacieibacterium frigidum]
MAVYTQVDAAALAAFLTRYDVGTALSFKGIAEGVENSNYFVATTHGRFILTLYEKRVDAAQLPYFLALTTHLADAGLPVPRPIQDREGVALQTLNGRPACLIQFVEGVSVTAPNDAETREVGAALGRLHAAVANFEGERPNGLGPAGWARLAADCAGRLDAIEPGLEALVADQLASINAAWPTHLDTSTIHADLFPDNVLMLGGKVTGLIDFYFACTDIRAYDIAVTHAAWVFDGDGAAFAPGRAAALIDGYRSVHALSEAEVAALPVLCRAASLRFLLTRAYDWLNTPAGAMVTRKDPLAFARRLHWYGAATPEQILGR